MDRPDLFAPGTSGAVRIVLPPEPLVLYDRDSVRLQVAGGSAEASLRAQVLLLDSARAVLWRSELVPVRGDTAVVPVASVPGGLRRGAPYRLTAAVVKADGERLYASDDSIGARSIAGATTREVMLLSGLIVRLPRAEEADLAGAASLGRAFFTIGDEGLVGVLDVAAGTIVQRVPAGPLPRRLAFRGGRLAVLGAGGGEVALFRAGAEGLSALSRRLLPALELEVDTTRAGTVGQSGKALALGCADASCERIYGVVPAGLRASSGAQPGGDAAGTLRIFPGVLGDTSTWSGVVVPAFSDVLQGDSSAVVSVFAASPAGGRVLHQRRVGASRCLAAALGGAVVAAGSGGVLFTVAAGAEGACGPGSAVLRLEHAGTDSVRVSAAAVRNLAGAVLPGPVQGMDLSDDESLLLLRAGDQVVLADPYFRLRGTLSARGVRGAVWRRGGSGETRFAVADAGGVTIYAADRMNPLARIPLGEVVGGLLFLHLENQGDVIVAGVAGGFVVATSPDP